VAQAASAHAVAELDAKTERAMAKTERAIAQLEKEMDIRFAKVDGELKLLRWRVGTLGLSCVAGVASLVVKAFF